MLAGVKCAELGFNLALLNGTNTFGANAEAVTGDNVIFFTGSVLTYWDGSAKTHTLNASESDVALKAGLEAIVATDKFTVTGGVLTAVERNAAALSVANLNILVALAPVTLKTSGTVVLNNNAIELGDAAFTASGSANISFAADTVFNASTGTIDVGNGAVTFVASSVLTLSEGAVLTAYATATDTQPITLTAGETGTDDDDVVLTNTAASVATLSAGVLTLPAKAANQATLVAKGDGAIVVGGADNSVTFTGATLKAGSHDDSGAFTLTGAGGLVAIGAGEGANGGSIELLKNGTITTAGTGKVTVGTGLQIGGAATDITASVGGGTAGVTFAAALSTSTITQKTNEAYDIFTLGSASNGIVFAGQGSGATVITLTASATAGAPVVFSGVDVTVPGNTANNAAGASLGVCRTLTKILANSIYFDGNSLKISSKYYLIACKIRKKWQSPTDS